MRSTSKISERAGEQRGGDFRGVEGCECVSDLQETKKTKNRMSCESEGKCKRICSGKVADP